jgi:hypothetical protein
VIQNEVQPALTAEVRRALMAEIGARSIYAPLEGRMRDPELSRVLASFRDDEDGLIDGVRALLVAVGAKRGPEESFTRAWIGWMLAVCSRGRNSALALRLSHDSECTMARRYHELSIRFARAGHVEHARACDGFAQVKQRHARVLEAWIPR